ncbi:hypothetical protein A2U01_0099641, partial [Trifolium medium]|nr:hypothetical protein [Trifolium medium]
MRKLSGVLGIEKERALGREREEESSDSSRTKVRELASIIVSGSEEGRMSIP